SHGRQVSRCRRCWTAPAYHRRVALSCCCISRRRCRSPMWRRSSIFLLAPGSRDWSMGSPRFAGIWQIRRRLRMADEHDDVISNALDAVDRGRRWAMLGPGALFGATILALGAVVWTGSQVAAPPQPFWGILNLMWVAFIAETLLMACCTAIVMLHVTRMAKAILRRIDAHG